MRLCRRAAVHVVEAAPREGLVRYAMPDSELNKASISCPSTTAGTDAKLAGHWPLWPTAARSRGSVAFMPNPWGLPYGLNGGTWTVGQPCPEPPTLARGRSLPLSRHHHGRRQVISGMPW